MEIQIFSLDALKNELTENNIKLVRTQAIHRKIMMTAASREIQHIVFEVHVTAKNSEIFSYVESIGTVMAMETRRIKSLEQKAKARKEEIDIEMKKDGFKVREGIYHDE